MTNARSGCAARSHDYDVDVEYLRSLRDLLERAVRIWVLDVLAVVFAIGLLFDTFVKREGAQTMIEAVLPYSGWLLLATVLLAVTVAYHQMRMSKEAAAPGLVTNVAGNQYNIHVGSAEEAVPILQAVPRYAPPSPTGATGPTGVWSSTSPSSGDAPHEGLEDVP